MTIEEFELMLGRGYEINDVEFKGPGSRTDRSFFIKVVRAILGMANRRDGGFVIIGVENKTLKPVGLEDEQLATWTDYDILSQAVNKYASPSLSFDLDPKFAYNSMNIVIIRVREFDEIPILCSEDAHDQSGKTLTLRRGACYVRSRHKPETAEVPSQEEMRELLELAIDKGVRRFITRAQKAGMFPVFRPATVSPSDDESFRKQIEDMG